MSDTSQFQDHLVVFSPSGRRGRFAAGTTVLAAARGLGVDLDSVCGGRGICGRCKIGIGVGDFPKHGLVSRRDHAGGRNAVEDRYQLLRGGLDPNLRLGCQARIGGDLLIDVPPESQVHRQVVRKRAEAHPIRIDPLVRLFYVEVLEPDMHAPTSDFGRLAAALAENGAGAVTADLPVLRDLQAILRRGRWRVTAAVRRDGRLVQLWPGFHDRALGLALDVGSTTIAAHLCDLVTGEVVGSAGVMNPQIRFGEDLMSRVSYVTLHPGGDAELTAVVRQAINDLARETAVMAGVEPSDVLDATVVGNPVMHHLLFGLDPTELGGAPFALAIDGALDVAARDLGTQLAPGARVYALPCIAGHVGADAAGMVLSEGPHLTDEVRLLVDVGTNAEIVLGNRARLLAASSPTGPAFEGAQITCGQRAAPGAIERVRIDPETLEPRFKVIGCDLWSDDPGFEAGSAELGVTGLCGSGIIELAAELFLAGVIAADGLFVASMAARSARVQLSGRTFSYILRDGPPRIAITQADVRAIQLAKAALYAGIGLLLERYGARRVDRITLAGAFGSYIDPRYAMILGLIPDCDLARVASAGNAAGTGARIALIDAAARLEIEELVTRIEKIETAIEPRFQSLFVSAMAFPHATDRFPELEKVVRLPAAAMVTPSRGARGRGRRP